MAIAWIASVKSKHQLSLFITPSLKSSQWVTAFKQSVSEFNRIAKAKALGVKFVFSDDAPTDKGGADVAVAVGHGQISATYQGTTEMEKFSAAGLHGRTYLFPASDTDSDTAKAFMFLPNAPEVFLPWSSKRRVAGAPLWRVIAAHELVHACGLENGDHSDDDFFATRPAMTPNPGTTASKDSVTVARPKGKFIQMPPLILGGKTIQKIKRNWS